MQALQLKRSFKENIADVYSLVGNDDGLITYALSKFYELVPEEERDFSLETFEGNEASVDDIINALAYGSMFGGRRFVTVRDMTAKLSVDDCEKLLDYVRQDDKQNVLILVNSPSIAKVLESYSVILDCNTMDLPSCVSYIQTLLKFYKVEFDNTAASAIANACNRDFARMNSEVDKIILYCGQEIKADRHTVEEIVPSDAETKVYEFISAGERLRQSDGHNRRYARKGRKTCGLACADYVEVQKHICTDDQRKRRRIVSQNAQFKERCGVFHKKENRGNQTQSAGVSLQNKKRFILSLCLGVRIQERQNLTR